MLSDFLVGVTIIMVIGVVGAPFIVIAMAHALDRVRRPRESQRGSLTVVKTDPSERPSGSNRPPNCS